MKHKIITLTLKVESTHAKEWVEELLDLIRTKWFDGGLETVTSEVSSEEE